MAWIAAAAAVLGLVASVGGQFAQAGQQKTAERNAIANQRRPDTGPDTFTPTAQQQMVPQTPPSYPMLMRPGYRPPEQFGASAPMTMMPQAGMQPDRGPQPSPMPPRLRETTMPATGQMTQPSPQTQAAGSTATDGAQSTATPAATASSSGASNTLQNAQMAVNMGQSIAQIAQMFQGQGGPPVAPRPQQPSGTPFQPTAMQFAPQRLAQMQAQQSGGMSTMLQQQMQRQRLRQMMGGM